MIASYSCQENKGCRFWYHVMKAPKQIGENEIAEVKQYYNTKGKEYIYNEALTRRVLPFVAYSLDQLSVEADYWHNIYSSYCDRTEEIISMLNDVFKKFESMKCISPCITENFAAFLISQSPKGCFCSGDVDISVDICERDVLRRAMEDIGYVRVIRKPYHAQIHEDEYLCPVLLRGKEFYINLVYDPVVREKGYSLDQGMMDKWLSNRRMKSKFYKDTFIKIMNAEDTLIHCVYHLSAGHYYSGAPGIRLIYEVDSILTNCNVNWDYIIDICKKLHIKQRLATAVQLSILCLNTSSDYFISGRMINSKLLIRILYSDSNGLIETKNTIGRLAIDILSEDDNVVISIIKKIYTTIEGVKNEGRILDKKIP